MEDWIKGLIFLGCYMLLGIILFEYSWSVVKPLRQVDEPRDSKYPAYRRWDAPLWSRWKFYPGAMLLLPLRLVIILVLLVLCYLSVRVVTIGYRFTDDRPVVGCRRKAIGYIYKFFSATLMTAISMRSTKRKIDFDYTEYLGEGYKETTVYPKFVSTIISNHSTWVDTTMLVQYFKNAFVSKRGLRNVPIMGIIS